MKKTVLSLALAAAAVTGTLSPLRAQTTCPVAPAPVEVSGSITSNTTWTADRVYLLKGFVFVESGATLTIQPGTIIKGDKASKGTLTIKQGAKIEARGTADRPIVFTSNQAPGERDRGDWGGLILAGKAPQNIPAAPGQPLPKLEGGLTPDTYFGGTDPNDNSGALQYVRIEFPGIAFTTDNEINGLTLAGVGAGTTLDHIQVSYSGDDSFEWFGGTVNAKYLVAFRGTDDEWDTDNGFAGKVQFGLSLRDPNIADVSGSNAFESDNDANGTSNSPQTAAVFSNISNFIAPASGTLSANFKRAMHIRRNSALSIYNSVVAGYPVGLLLDGAAAEGNAASGALQLRNNVFAGFADARVATVVTGSTYDAKKLLTDNGNDLTSTVADLNLATENFNLTNPFFQPKATSKLGAGAGFTGKAADAFFDKVSYRGAFAPEGATGSNTGNWAAGWTNFNPQLTCYNAPGVTTGTAKATSDQLQQLAVAPNPSNGPAELRFSLRRGGPATVQVFDLTGRPVATVLAGAPLPSGDQALRLPETLRAGVYLATVTTGETSQSVRFVVVK
ncbi:T9SS type A sorting domain-containing protein [Hymenobacter actinosclerus]|uniref:Por secretion system C-terminal sorting domain-containing protein n=1 Tax=Hymenobacter actinosclerus TaxID=82805 RepID=A0A1H9ZK91_9BACT|nr:T9SS type A sorting domain-containing protein [Hymenobacter actinosclerus]SES82021.1 Por secretion system C-terminal sorting domain-containing protein [Hymenobacter actinosclerus]